MTSFVYDQLSPKKEENEGLFVREKTVKMTLMGRHKD